MSSLPINQNDNPMELRENLARISFLAFLFIIYVSLFLLPQLGALL